MIEPITGAKADDVLKNPLGATPTMVAGFPAVETRGIGVSKDRECQVFVDIAENSLLQVAYSYSGTTVAMDGPTACAKARAAAELAMQTLLQR